MRGGWGRWKKESLALDMHDGEQRVHKSAPLAWHAYAPVSDLVLSTPLDMSILNPSTPTLYATLQAPASRRPPYCAGGPGGGVTGRSQGWGAWPQVR